MDKRIRIVLCIILALAAAATVVFFLPSPAEKLEYGYARPVSETEAQKRAQILAQAESWLGCKESDGSHKPIIDLYNSVKPLPQGYVVSYDDKWCATFVSAVAMQCNMTDIIPVECGCQRQIELFEDLGCWEENDAYVPLPGDLIYFRLGNTDSGDCTKWSDHVGIVVGTNGNKIKTIEGNFNGAVCYHYLEVDDPSIRGYALPDYST